MNWAAELCDLYDKNAEKAGVTDESGKILLPIGHSTAVAQITVTVDEKGNFISGETVSKENGSTLIPVTMQSDGARTSGIAPHPLCDKLKYTAGDYEKYCPLAAQKDSEVKETKEKKIQPRDYYQAYIQNLKAWKESAFSHPKVDAIYAYLNKKTLIWDLVGCGVLTLDGTGRLSAEVKFQTIKQSDAFVRFRVLSGKELDASAADNYNDAFVPECWLDLSLQRQFISYYKSVIDHEKDLSYLSGKVQSVCDSHPKKICNEGDQSKLISANDDTYFTYRGRFRNEREALCIGYEDSQKLHNALKWILRKQGFHKEGLSIAIWNSDLRPVPNFTYDSESLAEQYFEDYEEEEVALPAYLGTNEQGAHDFRAACYGYREKLSNSPDTVLMSFEAATSGRLSLTGYKVFKSSEYAENIAYWHESCRWQQMKWKDKKADRYEGMPSVYQIAELLYGTEDKTGMSFGKNNSRYAEVIRRLLPCITERKPVPVDMVRQAARRASNRVCYQKDYLWKQTLGLACALIKKDRNERFKEDWTLALDTNCRKRDYLYGRLLAVADRVEAEVLRSDRETNAERYMNAFAQKPYTVWGTIEQKLQPYFRKLETGRQRYFKRLFDEIYELFEESTFTDNTSLENLYLLGYHSQIISMYQNHKEKNSEENEND